MNTLLSWLCTSFSKVALFSLPEVFCVSQICQKCVGGWGSTPDPLRELTTLPYSPGEGDTPPHSPPTRRLWFLLDTRADSSSKLGASIYAPPPNVKSWLCVIHWELSQHFGQPLCEPKGFPLYVKHFPLYGANAWFTVRGRWGHFQFSQIWSGMIWCGHAKLRGRVLRVLRRMPGSSNSN